jgi:hypothetical protein
MTVNIMNRMMLYTGEKEKQVQGSTRPVGAGRGQGRFAVVDTPRAPRTSRSIVEAARSPEGSSMAPVAVAVAADAAIQQQREYSLQHQQTTEPYTAGQTPQYASEVSFLRDSRTLEMGFGSAKSSRPPPPGLGPPNLNVAQRFGLLNMPVKDQQYQLPEWAPQPQPCPPLAISHQQLQQMSRPAEFVRPGFSRPGIVVGFGRGGNIIAPLEEQHANPNTASHELDRTQFASSEMPHTQQISRMLAVSQKNRQSEERDNGDTETKQKRRARNLKKLLNQIADLQLKHDRGQELNEDQKAKLARRGPIEEELRQLEINT